MNRENNQIRFLLLQASVALTIIAIILLLYGAYLFNLQLISKSSIFITAGILATLSTLCIWRAQKDAIPIELHHEPTFELSGRRRRSA